MRSFFRSLRRWPAILVALALAASGAIAVATLPAAHASIPQNAAWKSSAPFGLWHNNFNIEVMMWVDNHRQVPAGHVIATVDIFGQKFRVWQSGHDLFSFALVGKRETSGKVHLLSALRWLVNHGLLSRSVTLRQV